MSLNLDILLEEASEPHVSPYLNIAYTDHGILLCGMNLCGMNYTMYVHDQTMKCFIYFYRLYDFHCTCM